MYIYAERLDKNVMQIVAYELDFDSENEFCAVFQGNEATQTVQCISRHRRSA